MKWLFLACLLASSALFGKIEERLIAHPDDPSKEIELLWLRPEGKGPFPLLLLIHGKDFREGARSFPPEPLRHWANKGILCAALSLPGYGRSDGGEGEEYSLAALIAALEELKALPEVKRGRVGLFGWDIGCTYAREVCKRAPEVLCLVCINSLEEGEAPCPTKIFPNDEKRGMTTHQEVVKNAGDWVLRRLR